MSLYYQNEQASPVYDNNSGHVPWVIRLWASVVRRATVDWVLYRNHDDPKLRKLGVEADAWIFGEDTGDFSSFEGVCDIIGLPVSLMRKKITGLTEEDARRLRGMEFGDD
mgnify:CR=1 FL=1